MPDLENGIVFEQDLQGLQRLVLVDLPRWIDAEHVITWRIGIGVRIDVRERDVTGFASR